MLTSNLNLFFCHSLPVCLLVKYILKVYIYLRLLMILFSGLESC